MAEREGYELACYPDLVKIARGEIGEVGSVVYKTPGDFGERVVGKAVLVSDAGSYKGLYVQIELNSEQATFFGKAPCIMISAEMFHTPKGLKDLESAWGVRDGKS